MTTTLTTRELGAIRAHISNGQPLWGMLIANEHLNVQDPLHRALRRTAEQALSVHDAVVSAVLGGKKRKDVSGVNEALKSERSLVTRKIIPITGFAAHKRLLQGRRSEPVAQATHYSRFNNSSSCTASRSSSRRS